MPGPLFHPSAVAQTYRDLNPGKFDEFDDKDLIDAIRDIDPATYKLIDPQLIGAEVLKASAPPPPSRRAYPNRPDYGDLAGKSVEGGVSGLPPVDSTYPLQHSFVDTAIETGLGVVPTIGGFAVGGPLGGGAGALVGSAAAQYYQTHYGNREEYSPGAMVFDAGMGMLNPGARGTTTLTRIGSQAAYGAGFGGVGTVGHSLIETGQMPSPGEFATGVATGAVMGGATHGAFEGYGAIKGRAPGFGDSTGALPVEGGPPPGPLDQLVTAQASAAQYQAEEERLAAQFRAIGGKRPAASPDYHDALQLKGVLKELAKLNAPPDPLSVTVPPMRPDAASLTTTPYATPPPPKLLERGEFSDPSQTDLVGYQPPPPPTIDRLGGQLEAGLQAPPRAPRLGTNRTLSLTPPPTAGLTVRRGTSNSSMLLSPPLKPTSGPLEQTGRMGGKPATQAQPRLEGVDQGVSTERAYPSGPNAGPRRNPRQELHGVPRVVRRRVDTGKTFRIDKTRSTVLAEDPGTYPPEVRREMARMLQELIDHPYERIPGGSTPGQTEAMQESLGGDIASTIGEMKRRGATSGGAIAGAPVYDNIRAAAEGAFKNVSRGKMIAHLREALLEGKGNGLTDAAAQVARGRIAQEARGGLTPEGYKAGKFTSRSGMGGSGSSSVKRMEGYAIISEQGTGDHLIGWEDAAGNRALGDQDLSEHQRAARDASDGELLGIAKLGDTGHMSEEAEHFITAARDEAVRRGLIDPQQLGLPMEGPGGSKGPTLFDFEGDEGAPPAKPATPSSRAPIDWGPGDTSREGSGRDFSLSPGEERSQKALEDLARLRGEDPDAPLEIPPHMRGEMPAEPPAEPSSASDLARQMSALRKPRPIDKLYGTRGPTPEQATQHAEEVRTYNQEIARLRKLHKVALERDNAAFQARQSALLGAEDVRTQDLPTPEVADLPFALSPPPAKPARPKVGTKAFHDLPLWERLKNDEGVLILPRIPAGDRAGLKKWLKAQEEEHGGSAWFSRVEHHLEEGNWDKAWQVAMHASVMSYSKAAAAAKTPQEEAALASLVKGTALQSDMNTQIIAGARKRAGVNEAPPVKDFPPSVRVSQAGAARGKATLGPAGVLNPGPVQRPLSSTAPELRSGLLDRNIVKMILEATDAEGISTVPGNRDTALRLFRQLGEVTYTGRNLKLLREAGVSIPPEALAQHQNNTISEWGRGLQMLQQFAVTNKTTLEEAAQQMSMGGALRGLLKGEAPPRFVGAGGREVSPAGHTRTMEALTTDTNAYEQAMVANTLQKKAAVGPLRALHDASYAFMLSKWNTAVRNYSTFVGRYTVDSLDHALTIPLAHLTGDTETAALSTALLKERGVTPFKTGSSVTPKAAWSDRLQEIHNFTVDSLNQMKPEDVRRSVRLLLDLPEAAANYLGSMTGEDLSSGFANVPVLRTLTNPRVQRMLTMFNRAQEFSARATVFDSTMRALLRAKGLDPTDLLQRPIEEIASAVGGRPALDDLLYTSTASALEATFAGRTSKDSIPGWLIRQVNEAWPLKLGVPFPKFNFSSAPRWLFDHSPAAILDLIRFPLDAAGVTAREGTMQGGRLYRGTRAQTIERKTLPNLQLQIGKAERAQGTALAELLSTQREIQIRNRQVARLEKRQQPGLQPGGETPLTEATALRDQLLRRRETLKDTMQRERRVVGDLKSEQKRLLGILGDARGINAPNFSQYLARIGVGTVGGLGAAWVIRSQQGAEGTRWYEYRIDREGKDPIIMDFRPFAPFAQYLFVADVANDFYRHTNWDAYHQQVEDAGGLVAGPLDRSKALWDNYEGKYTGQELGAQFAQAFLSISRAAGTTLTLTDLMTQNGWPGPREAADAIVGTIGQFLSRFTVPLQQVRDVMGQFDPEEAKTRIPPKTTMDEMLRPLASPIANIPGASRLIPESISQTTGKPIAAEYPLLRALAGIGTAPRDFVTEEVRRVGAAGQSVYIRETGDVGLDRMIAETYSRVLQEELPGILEDPSYVELGTTARQRDYLQRYIFPALKRAALAETRDALGDERYTAATVRGEAARYKARQTRMLDQLSGELPAAPVDPDAPPPGPPPTVDAGGGPPPAF